VAANKKGMLLKNVSPIALVVETHSAELANGVVLSGATGDQLASWYPEKRHGLFTYFFLKGVSGAADADGDGKVTAGEMVSYLETNVGRMALRLNGQDQKPILQGDPKSVLVRY
jgi:hypothetical protein